MVDTTVDHCAAEVIDPLAQLCGDNMRLAAEIQRLRHLLAFSGIDPDLRGIPTGAGV